VVERLGSKAITIELESWSWGATAMDPEMVGPAHKEVSLQDVNFVIMQSPTSVQLLEAMLAKKVLRRVVVRIKQPSSQMFELAMSNAKLSSYQTGGSGGSYRGGLPMEQLSMTFKSAKLTVKANGGSYSTDIIAN
jgi:hypothetical protein